MKTQPHFKKLILGFCTLSMSALAFIAPQDSTTPNQLTDLSLGMSVQAKTPKVTKTRQTNKVYHVTSTAYTANCAGCSGYTASGINIRNRTTYKGMRIIAADTRIFPIGTVISVKGIGKAIVLDTGGAMHGYKLDVLFKTKKHALQYGRKYNLRIRVLGKMKVHK